MSDIRIKICGLRRESEVVAVAEAGAHYCGFVFFPKSPRNVSTEQARDLALAAPVGLAKVALVVNPDDAFLEDILRVVPLDMIQLHGQETPQRVAEVRAKFGLPVMKAVGVATADDLPTVDSYQNVADQILIDTKAPKDADRPGGNGAVFDWSLVAGRRFGKPWMLAGGLTADNVGRALAISGARQVDLSSAVESAPGVKDPALIRTFVDAVRAAHHAPPRLV